MPKCLEFRRVLFRSAPSLVERKVARLFAKLCPTWRFIPLKTLGFKEGEVVIQRVAGVLQGFGTVDSSSFQFEVQDIAVCYQNWPTLIINNKGQVRQRLPLKDEIPCSHVLMHLPVLQSVK